MTSRPRGPVRQCSYERNHRNLREPEVHLFPVHLHPALHLRSGRRLHQPGLQLYVLHVRTRLLLRQVANRPVGPVAPERPVRTAKRWDPSAG